MSERTADALEEARAEIESLRRDCAAMFGTIERLQREREADRYPLGSMAEHLRAQPNRFRSVISDAIPWRERAMVDPTAAALLGHGATDAEAADVFAAMGARERAETIRWRERQAEPMKFLVVNKDGLRAAVLVERERCADVALSAADGYPDGSDAHEVVIRVAAAVRAEPVSEEAWPCPGRAQPVCAPKCDHGGAACRIRTFGL